LIGQLVDGGLDAAGADALLLALRADRVVTSRLRAHLLIAEIAAQELVPERGFSAFSAGLYERQRAEADGPAFLARVQARLAGEQVAAIAPDESLALAPAPLVQGLSPAGWWWAAAAAAAILVVAAHPEAARQTPAGDRDGGVRASDSLALFNPTRAGLPLGEGLP
jgi:hypothetical protein